MKPSHRIFILLGSIFLSCFISIRAARVSNPEELADSLAQVLANTDNTADSLRLMLDIFDLQPEKAQLMQIRRIYKAAKKLRDRDLQFDILRQWICLGIKWGDKGVIKEATKEFESMPECEDKRQTRVFIEVSRANHYVYKSDAERLNYLRQLLRECADMPDDTDPYKRVEKLYVLMYMLGKETQGDLLTKYTARLGKALDELPPLYHSYLRSQFNTYASKAFLKNDEYMRSVKCDRNLVMQLNRLEKFHREQQGRSYKNYEMVKYLTLRRIMSNYEVLSEKEIRDFHDQILRLAENDPAIAAEYKSDPTARIAIMELDGQYAEAIPHLKYLVEHAENMYDKRMYLRWLIKFAEKAGDDATKFEAERQNTVLIDTLINHHKSAERVRELELLYEVNNIRRIRATEQLASIKEKTLLLYIMGGIISVLLMIFIFLYWFARHRRKFYKDQIHAQQLELEKADKCRRELNELRTTMRKSESEKNQMLTYLSHELTTPLSAIVNYSRLIVENTSNDSRDYINNFASIIEVNADILREVAKDITEMQVGENRHVQVSYIPTNVNALIEITLESIKPQLKTGVTVEFIPEDIGNPTVNLDPRRVQIVLLSCISNMALLIEKGSISLRIMRDDKTCTFAITTLGKEIPEEKAKKVFAAWKDFDDDAKIKGIGLPNCQVILNALNATLTLDNSCQDGTRLLFTIPL